MSDITLVTVTADQPTGLGFVEADLRAQTVDVTQMRWLVVDDGLEPAMLTMGQQHVRREREPDCAPAQSFCRNLLTAFRRIETPYAIFIEHDDYVAPMHLEVIIGLLERPRVKIAGNGPQRYYNVKERCWRMFRNVGACFCQTAIHMELLPKLEHLVKQQLAANHYGIDSRLWGRVNAQYWALENTGTVLGIKGLPGRPGLGLGHRPTRDWSHDRDLEMLRMWAGEAAVARYAPFYAPSPALPLTQRRPR